MKKQLQKANGLKRYQCTGVLTMYFTRGLRYPRKALIVRANYQIFSRKTALEINLAQTRFLKNHRISSRVNKAPSPRSLACACVFTYTMMIPGTFGHCNVFSQCMKTHLS